MIFRNQFVGSRTLIFTLEGRVWSGVLASIQSVLKSNNAEFQASIEFLGHNGESLDCLRVSADSVAIDIEAGTQAVVASEAPTDELKTVLAKCFDLHRDLEDMELQGIDYWDELSLRVTERLSGLAMDYEILPYVDDMPVVAVALSQPPLSADLVTALRNASEGTIPWAILVSDRRSGELLASISDGEVE